MSPGSDPGWLDRGSEPPPYFVQPTAIQSEKGHFHWHKVRNPPSSNANLKLTSKMGLC